MLIDTHCHANLYLVLEEIIEEAEKSGVQKIISVSMSATSQERNLEIAKRFDMIYPALGIHPEEVKENPKIESQVDEIIELIRSNRDQICAIGEIGLDHHFVKNKELYPLQTKIFKKMLSIAQELKLPVNLHTKGAEKIVFDLLTSYQIPDVNIHWYSGPEDLLKEGMDRGYYFSITPAISYSPAVKNTATTVDINHLILESDGPVESRGTIWVPAMIKKVLDSISKLRNIELGELEKIIEENTKKIFPNIF